MPVIEILGRRVVNALSHGWEKSMPVTQAGGARYPEGFVFRCNNGQPWLTSDEVRDRIVLFRVKE